MPTSPLRHIPNVLSAARLACVPVLIGLALANHQRPFAWLMIAAFLSDAIDGLIARAAGVTSKTGALLDSAADLSLQLAVIYGVWSFHEPFVRANAVVFLLVLSLWAFNVAVGYYRYGRVASFHTYTSRAAAYVMAAFLAVLFLWGVKSWLFYTAVAVILLALIEELVLIALLAQWTSDVRGLYWVLRARRDAS